MGTPSHHRIDHGATGGFPDEESAVNAARAVIASRETVSK